VPRQARVSPRVTSRGGSSGGSSSPPRRPSREGPPQQVEVSTGRHRGEEVASLDPAALRHARSREEGRRGGDHPGPVQEDAAQLGPAHQDPREESSRAAADVDNAADPREGEVLAKGIRDSARVALRHRVEGAAGLWCRARQLQASVPKSTGKAGRPVRTLSPSAPQLAQVVGWSAWRISSRSEPPHRGEGALPTARGGSGRTRLRTAGRVRRGHGEGAGARPGANQLPPPAPQRCATRRRVGRRCRVPRRRRGTATS